jgi:hypothetical protein
MSFINPARYFPEKITYWAQLKQDGYGGESWTAPQVINCKWEDSEAERLSVAYRSEAETIISTSHLYTAEKLVEGAYVYRGISTEANPSRIVGPDGKKKAFVIRSVTQITGIKGDYMQNLSLL